MVVCVRGHGGGEQETSLTSHPTEAGVKGPQPSSHVTVSRVMLNHGCGSTGSRLHMPW